MEMGAVSDTHTHAGEGVQQPPRRTATTTISRALSPWEKKRPNGNTYSNVPPNHDSTSFFFFFLSPPSRLLNVTVALPWSGPM